MTQKYVPLEKRSKRQQKEYHAQQRKTWQGINPVTKKVESAKVYNRKKSKQRWGETNHEPCLDFLYFIVQLLPAQFYPDHIRSFQIASPLHRHQDTFLYPSLHHGAQTHLCGLKNPTISDGFHCPVLPK